MIEVIDVKKSFGSVDVLRGVTLVINNAEVVAIVGPSGAGKTTLLQIIGTLDTSYTGKVFIDNTDISLLKGSKLAQFRNKNIGFVFQSHNLLSEFTAVENVMIPALIAGVDKKECRDKAMELLKLLGVEHRAEHKPSALSGGEAQRVAVARAVINNPSLILADEPSGNLDTKNREELHKLFFQLRDTFGVTVVVVTHDEHLASMSDRKINITDGLIVQ